MYIQAGILEGVKPAVMTGCVETEKGSEPEVSLRGG